MNALTVNLPNKAQIMGVFSDEMKRSFLSKRAALIYILGLIPIGLFIVHLEYNDSNHIGYLGEVFAHIYVLFILRGMTFFAALWLFLSMFRGKIHDHCLHYYFMVPMTRGQLMLAHYISGVALLSCFTFIVLTICYSLFLLSWGLPVVIHGMRYGSILNHFIIYGGITSLACITYGALFLMFGLFFKNSAIPSIMYFFWELINPLMPPFLKKLTISHHLLELIPVALTYDPLGETQPTAISIGFLLGFTLISLAIASWKIDRAEIDYSLD